LSHFIREKTTDLSRNWEKFKGESIEDFLKSNKSQDLISFGEEFVEKQNTAIKNQSNDQNTEELRNQIDKIQNLISREQAKYENLKDDNPNTTSLVDKLHKEIKDLIAIYTKRYSIILAKRFEKDQVNKDVQDLETHL
jgi:archaellum component FlaC